MESFIENKKYFIAMLIMFILFTLYTNNKEKDKLIFEETSSNIILEETADEFEKRLIYIHLAGNVGKPGLYEIEEGSRLNDLIIPGQITDMNTLDRYFNRAQLLSDGEKIYIPFPEELVGDREEPRFYTAPEEQGKININTASLGDLVNLPGIGETKARDIIDFREKNGKFKIIDDIMMVKGIGTATFERIKDLIKT